MSNKKNSIRKLQLSDINDLSIAVFICKRNDETKLIEYCQDIGGVLLTSMRAKGLSRGGIASTFGAYSDMNVVLIMCLSETAKDLVHDVSSKFKFTEPGNGKGFLIDADGYMGAKAAFI